MNTTCSNTICIRAGHCTCPAQEDQRPSEIAATEQPHNTAEDRREVLRVLGDDAFKDAATEPAGETPSIGAQLDSIPQEVQEWIWHMDLHLTEHDIRHAGLALRAAWPSVRDWMARLKGDYISERNSRRTLERENADLRRERGFWMKSSVEWKESRERNVKRAEEAERQRDAAYERMRFLLDQVERGNLTDDHGHDFKMNKSYCDAVAFMKEV